MITDLLENNIDYFKSITIKNGFNKSLKSIRIDNNLDIDILRQDLQKLSTSFKLNGDAIIEWRIKNIESLKIKINKYLKFTETTGESWSLKSVTNDLIGARVKYIGDKNETIEALKEYTKNNKYYRAVDMLNGKATNDDGYRAIHIYFTEDNFHYPIEIQLWFNEDYNYNFLMHKYLYKQKSIEVLKEMYSKYTNGLINSEEDFIHYMKITLNKQQNQSNKTINVSW